MPLKDEMKMTTVREGEGLALGCLVFVLIVAGLIILMLGI